MNIPDIVGFTLGRARELLENNGITIADISVTAPPRGRGGAYGDYSRIVRLEAVGEKRAALLVCNVGCPS